MSPIKKYIALVMTGFAMNVSAQQTPSFGFNSQFLSISNPSLTKSINPLELKLAARKYWNGVQNSPEAFLASFSLSPIQFKSAFGGYYWSEKAPLLSKQIVGFNYAYSVKNMSEGNNLRFGAGLDFISLSSNTSGVLTADYDDPYYTQLLNNSKSAVDFRVGTTWNNDVLEIGLSAQQIIKSKNTLGESVDGSLNFNNPMITSGHVKYTIQPDEDFMITPLVYWQLQKTIPARVDLNLLVEKTGKLWGGLWLRPQSSMGVMAGIWVLPDVKLGYQYEKSFFKKLSKLGNSHELLVSYTPSLANRDDKEKDKVAEVKENEEKAEPKILRIRDTIVIVKETRVIETPSKATPTIQVEEKKESPNSTSSALQSKFYVVTGLFSVEANANNYSKKLAAEGYKTSLVKNPDTGQFYVSVGNFSSLEDARKYIVNHPNSKFTFWVKEIKP